jgi:predicted acyltransferase
MSAQTVANRERLVSLDAYRGMVMLAMASGGFGLEQVAARPPYSDQPIWRFLAEQFTHVPWRGGVFWDMIQPSFMFMVGVSMAWSYARRQAQGHSYGRMFGHAVWRSIVLVLLGIFLMSNGARQTNFTFVNVLTQIGLGYTLLFLLWGRGAAVQFTAVLLILGATWAAFYFYPLPPADFDPSTVGVPPDFPTLHGMGAHWNKNTNFAAAVDREFLNWFPREQPFLYNDGGYQTLNFVPSLATMILGLMVGESLRAPGSRWVRLLGLALFGALLVGSGYALDYYQICPAVKRIWTPSWALYSGGWACWMLAGFYAVIDCLGLRWLGLPLAVVGMNSILIYVLAQLSTGWIARSLQTHFGQQVFSLAGEGLEPLVRSASVLLVLWLLCVWLYRRKLFFKI